MKIFYRPWVQNLDLDGCKLAINHKERQWHYSLPTDDGIVKFFRCCSVSFVKFSCWFKFHVNIMTGSGVMTIFIYEGLTRDLEIRNTTFWVLPSIWRLGWVRNTKFGTNVSNKMLLNDAKCQGYNFCFWFIQGNPTGGIKLPPPPTLGLSGLISYISILCNMLF